MRGVRAYRMWARSWPTFWEKCLPECGSIVFPAPESYDIITSEAHLKTKDELLLCLSFPFGFLRHF